MKNITILSLFVALIATVFTLEVAASSAIPNAVLYYKPSCPHCHDVEALLRKMGKTVTMKDVSNETYSRELTEKYHQKGVPVLVVGSQVYSGSTRIRDYLNQLASNEPNPASGYNSTTKEPASTNRTMPRPEKM